MKPHLPLVLLGAALAVGAAAYADVAATDLGNVMYVGDSITHGVNSQSYRWQMHKLFVDNGIDYNAVGYKTGYHSTPSGALSSYGNIDFSNTHSSQSGARAWEISGRASADKNQRFNGTNIKNWLGLSTEKADGSTYTGSTYEADTFFLLIGTNDLLSDGTSGICMTVGTEDGYNTITTNLLGESVDGVRSGGDVGAIVDAMYESNADARVVMLTIPCWTLHQNSNDAVYHENVARYNEELAAWVSNYNAKITESGGGVITSSS